MRNRTLALTCLVLTCTATAQGGTAEVTLETAPAVVVKTVPEAGSKNVDPALTEIKATFSKPMLDKSWSWVQISEKTFPDMVGESAVTYLEDNRTCVLKVKLKEDRTYAIWLNSERFSNFKDVDGRSAVPYLLVFQTGEPK